MDLRRWTDIMRTRTALVLFFASMLAGGLVVFAWGVPAGGPMAAPSGAVKKQSKADRSAVEWRPFGPGMKEAEKRKKMVLVDVYTDWCGWCKRMDANTYTDSDVRSYIRSSFVPVKLNAESQDRAVYLGDEYSYRQLAAGFGVTGYPTTIFIDHDGTRITAVPGYMRPQEFLTVLRFIGGRHYESKSFQQFREGLQSTGD